MELFIQAVMESLQEGTIPLAYLLMLIWSFNGPLRISGLKQSWSRKNIIVPLNNNRSTTNSRAIEAYCSRMLFGKAIKRKVCPDDSDDAYVPFSI